MLSGGTEVSLLTDKEKARMCWVVLIKYIVNPTEVHVGEKAQEL